MTDGLIKCIIVDDEEMATKVLESHLSHVPEFRTVGIYHSAVEAFLAMDDLDVDVMFLDIQMPKMTGLSLLKMLKDPPITVLTTAHREYAIEAFELEAIDYLLKPISLKRFLQTISRIQRRLRASDHIPSEIEPSDPQPIPSNDDASDDQEVDHVFIRSNRAFIKVNHEDIRYVEAIKNHIKVVTRAQSHISLMPISEFSSKLPEKFVRVHRSFLVNSEHIVKFANQSVFVAGKEIPIGRSYKKEVKRVLEKRFGV